MRSGVVLSFVLWVSLASGCEEGRPPGVGGGGGLPPTGGPVGGPDAGRDDGGPTGGDGGIVAELCQPVVDTAANRLDVRRFSDGTPLEAEATHVGVSWDCFDQRLDVVLGTDAACNATTRGSFRMRFRQSDIGGAIGTAPLEATDPSLALEYVDVFGGGPLTWGSCPGASGVVELFDSGAEAPGVPWRGTFDLILLDCRSPALADRLVITGGFSFLLPATFEQVCAP